MTNRFGFVNAEGELEGIISPGSDNQYNHLEVMGDRVCVVIPEADDHNDIMSTCLLYTSPSPRDATLARMPSSA